MPTSPWNPGSLLALSGDYWKTCALHTAVQLDLFTHLADQGPLSGPDLAGKAQTDPEALTRLLDALTAMELLEKTADRYHNTPAADQFLVAHCPAYIGHMILHHHHLMASWQKLPESIRTGRPVRESAAYSEATVRTAFLKGMANISELTAPDLVGRIDLGNRRHLLDLGGGPGIYAAYFCRQNPDLTATIFDLPTTGPVAEETRTRLDLSDRLTFLPGDYLTQEIPVGYEVIWMSHIIHGEGPADVGQLLRKAWRALAPEGLILIHDFILDKNRTRPLFAALFSLNMLLGTEQGRSYTESEIFDLLTAAGFSGVTRLDYRGPTDSGVIRAVKS